MTESLDPTAPNQTPSPTSGSQLLDMIERIGLGKVAGDYSKSEGAEVTSNVEITGPDAALVSEYYGIASASAFKFIAERTLTGIRLKIYSQDMSQLLTSVEMPKEELEALFGLRQAKKQIDG